MTNMDIVSEGDSRVIQGAVDGGPALGMADFFKFKRSSGAHAASMNFAKT